MTKGQIIIGLAVLAVIIFQGLMIHHLMGSISAQEKEISTLEGRIEAKEAIIVANEETLTSLMEEKSNLLQKNHKLDQVLASLLDKPENKDWGCTELPQDMIDFISENYNMECKLQ